MKDFSGIPGTFLGLILRITQFGFAVASIASMASAKTPRFFNFTTFCSLMSSMALQSIWSFALALLDTHALVRKKIVLNPVIIGFYAVGDGVISTLSLAAASASAGVTIYYFNDMGNCHFVECQKYQISVVFAILSWISASMSSLIMLWLLGAA
ncbi:CASP-like protein 5B3 [Vicia villosa]|uniref:CASP-like protein 5B3 n=1 Tax=Vicia villosa TaxID=3911 RepID=UPI00273B4A97|nr:CASP-like protein 5B3 [Vicia villosa]